MIGKLGEQPFFQGIMLWRDYRTGLSFLNRRNSKRVDIENMDAFFFAFHEKKEVLEMVAEQFNKFRIMSKILPLCKYTEGKQGFVLETERHSEFTEEFEKWYNDKGGMN